MSNTCKQKSGSTQLGVPTRGDSNYNLATALWLSLLPANHPRSAAPPKRIAGRTAAIRLRLCPCLTPASKNHVQLSSGCRQTSNFTSNLATALCVSLLPVAHPRPHCSTKTSRRRPFGIATAPSSSMPNTCKQESGSTQLGVPTRGRFHSKPRDQSRPGSRSPSAARPPPCLPSWAWSWV